MKRSRWVYGAVASLGLIGAGGLALSSAWNGVAPVAASPFVRSLSVVHHVRKANATTQPTSVQTMQYACPAGEVCSPTTSSPHVAVAAHRKAESVDVFGGSMTYGWVDPAHDSFVQRAIATLSATTGVRYRYHNYAIPGFTAEHYEQKFPGRFARTIRNDHAQVVILAWGLENDMNNRHTLDTTQAFAMALHQEITQTLAAHALAVVVTPPVTKQLVTVDRLRVYQYIDAEHQVVKWFHSPDVVWVNLYKQMNHFLVVHHQTYKRYEGNAWHPNRAGHILAGHILAQDLSHHFGKHPMAWQRPVVYS